MRICRTCNRELPEDKFYFSAVAHMGKDGYALDCKECYLIKCVEWRRAYRLRNREKERERQRLWVRNNPEKHAVEVARWRESHPKQVTAQNNIRRHRRRARVAQASGSHTLIEWEAKLMEFNYCCAYCGEPVERLEKDHVIPISKGGTDNIDNIVPACRYCNASKHDKIWAVRRVGTLQPTKCDYHSALIR